jgi:hypothetical protein
MSTGENKMQEQWNPVVGFKGLYEVSDFGRVRSIARTTISTSGKSYTCTERILSACEYRGGYLHVGLYKDGVRTMHKVHRLVMESFCGASHLIVDHIDGNRQNNNLSNLRYCTHRQNTTYSTIKRNSTSKYTGVCWHKVQKKWMCSARVNGKIKHIGYFINEDEAGKAYQEFINGLD